ncbi:hypothetical protein BJ973_007881 [Actinoplanes tereljensis]|uniref:Transglycosylase SLT domain-containing protein n=1 Tax=Paractinoplanes tereljensis TaxID=571912 RepID=A0A919NUV6_9ACTN|nr:hypothetical protein [Actinoplanes tereljensis]GIF24401.1 hypothetical protein Ate02nite_71310 [Actinoplanes tereljensis]
MKMLALTTVATLATIGFAAPAQAEVPHPGGVAAPDTALGKDWKSSSDVVVTGAGDADGYHLYIAREKDAFGWRTLATLKSSAIDVGPWGGSVCVTGSGRYAVAIFAPKKAANDPALMMAGALAAVVDTTTGRAKTVAAGLQFTYFNPACGPGDKVLLTRATGNDTQAGRRTDLLTVDAAAGKVVQTRHIEGQLSTPAPAPDGDYGIAGGRLVKVGADGKLTALAKPQGIPYAVRAARSGAIDVVSVTGAESVAERFANGRFTTTGSGPRNQLDLFGLQGGRNALVGTVNRRGAIPADLPSIASAERVDAISGAGHLVVHATVSRQTSQAAAEPLVAASPDEAGQVTIKQSTVAGRAESTATVDTDRAAPTLDVDLDLMSPVQTVTTFAEGQDPDQPKCAVPRNDPTIQPLQPSPDQVEWAVDRAVRGTLDITRPDNYLKSRTPSYSPQGMFPLEVIKDGYASVPAQVELAVLAQETNLSQASWHAVPGDTGNPLISAYYGSYDPNVIDYEKSDCGYGIGQVTTGMADGDTVYSIDEQIAISVDYAANIAASVNILIDKWNQLHDEPNGLTSSVNNNDPQYIENWFLALWAYNSGLHRYADRNTDPDANGYYGLGWLNNPANPDYKPGRDGFMRQTTADAETPSKWSYPERIMGWVETPQRKGTPAKNAYLYPAFGAKAGTFHRESDDGDWSKLTLPSQWTFCSADFGCSQAANGCPAVNSSCWWHGHADFANCDDQMCATENVKYFRDDPEPGVQRVYERDCETFDPSKVANRDSSKSINMVYTLNDTSLYNLGCSIPSGTLGGKFVLRGGRPAGQDGAPYAQYDLHQLGAGYNGHIWFTHGASGDALTKHKVVGAWTPELPLGAGQAQLYSVVAHQPSHGATAQHAAYLIQGGSRSDLTGYVTCSVPQDRTGDDKGKDHWVNLGSYLMGRGAQVLLSNEGAGSSEDVGYDAMAFIPQNAPGATCNTAY